MTASLGRGFQVVTHSNQRELATWELTFGMNEYPVLIKLKSLKRFAARITQTRAALVSIMTVLALGGCATAYHEDNAVNRFLIEPGGYRVSDLGEDRYQVWFVANRHTSLTHSRRPIAT